MKIPCHKCGLLETQEKVKRITIPLLGTKYYICHWCLSEHCKIPLQEIKTKFFHTYLSVSKQEKPKPINNIPFKHKDLLNAFQINF